MQVNIFLRKILIVLISIVIMPIYAKRFSEEKLGNYERRAKEIYAIAARNLENEKLANFPEDKKKTILEVISKAKRVICEWVDILYNNNRKNFDELNVCNDGAQLAINEIKIISYDIYFLNKAITKVEEKFKKLFENIFSFAKKLKLENYILSTKENFNNSVQIKNCMEFTNESEAIFNFFLQQLQKLKEDRNLEKFENILCPIACAIIDAREEAKEWIYFMQRDIQQGILNFSNDDIENRYKKTKVKLEEIKTASQGISLLTCTIGHAEITYNEIFDDISYSLKQEENNIERPLTINTEKPVTIYVHSAQGPAEEMKQDSDLEAHFFIPKKSSLTMQEKEENIFKRISKKYIGEIPAQVQDIISYFNQYENCVENHIGIHNKLLLYGKPGIGKSYLVKVLAEQLEVPLLSFTASFFNDKYIGESSRRIRRAFDVAKSYKGPIFIFIDEIDGLAVKRKSDMHIENRATLLTLLTEIQNIQEYKHVFVFVATNDLKVLDAAIKDRFSGAKCEIKELSVKERARLFTKVFSDKGVKIDARLAERLAEVTKSSIFARSKDYFSNRDIEYIVTTALLKEFLDHKKSSIQCKHICSYIRTTMDAMKKKGRFAWLISTYCNGI